MKLHQVTFKTPLGDMLAITDQKALYQLKFIEHAELAQELNRIKTKMQAEISSERTSVIDSIENEIKLYFAGKLREFKTPKTYIGTAFQQKVWQELNRIPYGETRSYLQIAEGIGNPLAFRAAAQANSVNKMVIVVPCHRVINASGNLGGYSSGLERKKWLLNHESRK